MVTVDIADQGIEKSHGLLVPQPEHRILCGLVTLPSVSLGDRVLDPELQRAIVPLEPTLHTRWYVVDAQLVTEHIGSTLIDVAIMEGNM